MRSKVCAAALNVPSTAQGRDVNDRLEATKKITQSMNYLMMLEHATFHASYTKKESYNLLYKHTTDILHLFC